MNKDWKEVELGSIGVVRSGGTPKTKITEYWEGDISWITPADLSGYTRKYISKGKRNITEEGLNNSSAKLMPKGSVLFSSRAPIGYAVIAQNELCTNQGFKSMIPSEGALPEFIYYQLKSMKNVAEKNASGTTFKELSAKAFSKLPFYICSLPEQRAVVSKIEELFSELDNGIENLIKAKDKLEIYRQAVLKKAFEGDLTKEWRIDNSVEREEWKQKTLGDVLTTVDGDRGKNYPKKHEFKDEGYCLFLSTKNVRKGDFVFDENIFITKEKDEILRGGKLIRNDVVITTRGTLGNVALYDDKVKFDNVRINSGMLILRVNNMLELNPLFLMRFINSSLFFQQLKSKQSGTAQPQIPAGILREIEIEIPDGVDEQMQIIQEVESRLSVCDNILINIEECLKKSESLRQSILKKAFEGMLLSEDEVNECRKEPDWEPVEKLLERIKEMK
jgi:type I restriction enzyme S subunit